MASSEENNISPTVSEGLLLDLAGKLGKEWLDLARYLNVSEACLHNIKANNIGNIKEAKYQALISWKQANGGGATHSSLADALLESGRRDLSEKVKQADSSKKSEWRGGKKELAAEKKTLLVKELRNKYRNLCGRIRPVPFLRDQYAVEELFVESGMKFLEEEYGKRKEREKWKLLGAYKTIFTDPQINSKRRIIDAEPGYGKSILALMITHDWCLEKPHMKEFEILILLQLRQFREVTNVYAAIKRFLLPVDSKLKEEDIKSIFESSSTMFLFDGYDEYPGRGKEDTDIECIIRGDMFQDHEVILMTRTACLPLDPSVDTKRISLTGFDDNIRQTYVQDVVVRGDTEKAAKLLRFLEQNPVYDDLCNVPLFFVMVPHMAEENKSFQNLKTVTDFFRGVIACFHSHQQIKGKNRHQRRIKHDHSQLDKEAFEALRRDSQGIIWDKDELQDMVGDDLYNEYVSIGILIEEDIYDDGAWDYKTETRFFHKLFAEWFAAHYLANHVAQSEEESASSQASDTQQHPNREEAQLLSSLDPNDVHYTYRFACCLNNDAGRKIITYLGSNSKYDKYTLLCMAEWGGSLEAVREAATTLCSRTLYFRETDSLQLQKSTIALIKYASSQKIPIDGVCLSECLYIDCAGNLCVQPSNLSLPIIDASFFMLWVYEYGRVMTEEKTDSILQYAAKCRELKLLQFSFCLLPQYVKDTDYISVLVSRNVQVVWSTGLGMRYLLNLTSVQWEDESGTPMTNEQYQEVEERVSKLAEEREHQRMKKKVSVDSST